MSDDREYEWLENHPAESGLGGTARSTVINLLAAVDTRSTTTDDIAFFFSKLFPGLQFELVNIVYYFCSPTL